jgi:hypothetical protein
MGTPKKQASLKETLPIGSEERSKLTQQLEPRVVHGGNSASGKRKTPRPFNGKAPLHLVLHSKRAKGPWSFTHKKNQSRITAMIYVYGARFKVHVYRAAIEGDELQLLVKAKERKHLADFLRVLAGRVAVTVTGAKKGKKQVGKFWDFLYWSKLINWGPEFFHVQDQIKMHSQIEKEVLELKLK